jgi:hypothetical protein
MLQLVHSIFEIKHSVDLIVTPYQLCFLKSAIMLPSIFGEFLHSTFVNFPFQFKRLQMKII